MKEFKTTNTKVTFKDVQIGQFFKEDHEAVYEVFLKVSERQAVSQDDNVTCKFYDSFPALLVSK